jgi:hypothetical protein
MADEHGVWAPLSPVEIARLFHEVNVPWWIAGGWVIDLLVGEQTRPHDDIDVLILREDQLAAQTALPTWELQAPTPSGPRLPWQVGDLLPSDVHNVWCRPNSNSPWALELMLEEASADRWVFRRDRRITRPLATLTRRAPDGLPCLAPEVQLLYKARSPRPKDEHDFEVMLPHLDDEERDWLGTTLRTCYPEHPWLVRL